jgi:hypothetical protein
VLAAFASVLPCCGEVVGTAAGCASPGGGGAAVFVLAVAAAVFGAGLEPKPVRPLIPCSMANIGVA